MTSEYENGPDLFGTAEEQGSSSSAAQKPPRRVVKRRPSDPSGQVVVKVKPTETSPEASGNADSVSTGTPGEASHKPVSKKRGRPPRKQQPEAVVEEKAIPVQAPPERQSDQPVSMHPQQQAQPFPQNPSHQNPVQHRPQQSRNHQPNGKQNNRQKQNHQKGNYQARQNNRSGSQIEDIPVEIYIEDPNAARMVVNDLTSMTLPALRQQAADFNISQETILDLKRQDLIVEILKAHALKGGVIMAYGALEVLPDGYGFLRSPQNNYLSGPEDIYVSISQIKMLSLKTGDTVEGQIRPPRDAERYFAMIKVQSINHDPPEVARARAGFDSLTPLYPDTRLNLETEESDISTRIINLFSPIGKGQRSLIVAPPRAGKTILMQKIANAISENHPEVYLMVLLIDERPEEVTDMRRTVKGEVIASTFDEQASRHVSVAEMVIEKAKRLVEHKRDVVILLDNITRLARAYNQTVPASGKILSGGVDSNALHKPKRFLGAARNIEHGGSLTIIASALIETGSRMDEVIFEEFKGTGNNEIVLDRRMAERRLYPAINIKKSGTRREDLLLTQEEAAKIWALRNAINPMEDIEMTELLIDKMKKTKNNEAFLRSMNSGAM